MSHDSSSSNLARPDPAVEEAYLEFLARREQDPELSFDKYAAEHADLAGELWNLHRAWSWFDGVRPPPDDGAPRPGEPYRVEGEIARGGMGVVYGVWDERLRRRLAMKVSRIVEKGPGSGGSPRQLAVARFVEEAQITAQLDHPGVVPVHDMGTDASGRRFFTMRRVEGRTLDEVFELAVDKRESWSRTRALAVLVQVCETIAFAHSRGVVHRDLKPSNVMVGRFGETYVMDWGLAKVVGRESETDSWVKSDRSEAVRDESSSGLVTFAGAVVGTPAYMAPEQASGRASDAGPEVDVYALGAILYHLLAGRPPYGREAGAVLDAVRKGPPPSLDRETPPELVAICERAMARDPLRRYQSAEALRDDLRAFLENRVVGAHRTGALAELSKWVARNRGLAAAFAAILVLIVAALALQVEKSRAIQEGADEARRLLGEARFEGYIANIAAAAKALDLGDAAMARRRLDACPPEERDFEWRHLVARLDASIASVDLGESINSLDVRSDTGETLVAYSSGELSVVDVQGRETPVEIEASVYSAVWLPDGSIVAASRAGWLRRLDPATGELLASLEEGSFIRSLALDPARERVAVGREEGLVEVRDATSLVERVRFSTGERKLNRVAWSPRGDLLAAAYGPGTITVWDLAREVELRTIDASADLGPVPADWAPVVFGPEGETVLVGRPDGSIGAWWVADGTLAFVLTGHAGRVIDLLPGEDASTLFSCSRDLSIAIWDLDTGRMRDRMPGHLKVPMKLALGPEPGLVVSAGWDGTFRTWPAGGRRVLDVLEGHEDTVFSVAASSDGVHVVSGAEDAAARIWDVGARQCVRTITFERGAHVRAACGPDPDTLLISAGLGRAAALHVYDLQSGARRVTLGKPPYHNHHPLLSPDGRWAASTIENGTALALFSVTSGAERARLPGRYPGWASFTPDGQRILVGTASGQLYVASVPELEPQRTLEGHSVSPRACVASPDGELWATGYTDGVIKLWDARAGEAAYTLEGHDESVTSLAFSPDGRRLASASYDKSVQLWDVRRRKVVLTLTGHTAPVLDVAYSPDGEWIASAADDATVRIWDTRPARELLPTVLKAERVRAAATPRVAALRAELVLAEDVLAALRGDSSLSAEELEAATELVQSEPEAAWILNERSWVTARERGRAPREYERAVREARAAARLEPEVANHRNTLGVALYRLGRVDEALSQFLQAAELNRESGDYHTVWDGAFVALCLSRLECEPEARAELESVLRELAHRPEPSFEPFLVELRERFGELELPR